MARWLTGAGLVGMCLLAASALALQGLPSSIDLPKDVILYDPPSLVKEGYAAVDFPIADGKTVTKNGRHVRTYLKWTDANYKPAAATWAKWKPMLLAKGWQLQNKDGDSSGTYTLKRTEGGVESWLRIGLNDNVEPLLELIEVGESSRTLVLKPPGEKPEKLKDKAGFPWLAAPAGAKFSGTGHFNDPLDVTVPGVDADTQLIGSGYVVKTYTPPKDLSKLEFEQVYRKALAAAGWQVKPPAPDAANNYGRVVAHYTKDGRNIWVELGRGNDDSDSGLAIKAADIGAEDWAAKLKKTCRVALYGVTFDFNKATLRADSKPELEKVQALLAKAKTMRIEVQGHTDNVGGDAYNMKLSDARAKSVVDWLTAHEIAAGAPVEPRLREDAACGRQRKRCGPGEEPPRRAAARGVQVQVVHNEARARSGAAEPIVGRGVATKRIDLAGHLSCGGRATMQKRVTGAIRLPPRTDPSMPAIGAHLSLAR